jgi:hypothetical protein
VCSGVTGERSVGLNRPRRSAPPPDQALGEGCAESLQPSQMPVRRVRTCTHLSLFARLLISAHDGLIVLKKPRAHNA